MESPYTLKITVNGVNLYSLASDTLYQLYSDLQGENKHESVAKLSKCELLDSVVKLIHKLYCRQDWEKYVLIRGLYDNLV